MTNFYTIPDDDEEILLLLHYRNGELLMDVRTGTLDELSDLASVESLSLSNNEELQISDGKNVIVSGIRNHRAKSQ